MFRAGISSWWRLGLALVCGVWLAAASAWGQSAATLRELGKLHARIADPKTVLTVKEAKRAADRLAEWKLTPEKLEPEDRARLWRVELYVALGTGEARTALERAQALLKESPDRPATLEAAYLAACAAGDARLGSETLKKLAKLATGDQRRVVSERRRWMRGVGRQAPDVVIRTEDLTEVSTRRRGDRLLLIDFWNVLMPPEQSTSEALRALREQYRDSLHFEMVGVNADSEARTAEAKQFAEQHGYVWKQRYEYAATGAAITHKAFRAGKPPWQVLIDTFGYVRAVGSVSEPGLQYALRAALAEARGEQELILPRTRDGQQPELPGARLEPKVRKPAEPEGEPPSNLEALQKLRLARTYLKTGKRTDAKRLLEEVVRDYPGTREAQEAQEILEAVWNP